MDVLAAIYERSSAGMQAPSGNNRQPWRFMVVEGDSKTDMLKAMNKGLEREAHKPKLSEIQKYMADARNTIPIMKQAKEAQPNSEEHSSGAGIRAGGLSVVYNSDTYTIIERVSPMKIKKSTRLYAMIALISILSSLSTVCFVEYLRTPPTAAYADERQLREIIQLLETIKSDIKAFKWEYLKRF